MSGANDLTTDDQLYVAEPGLEGVIAGDTDICAVEQTGLSCRGHTIEDLANHCRFEEVAHLLLFGELETARLLSNLNPMIQDDRPPHDAVVETLRMNPTDTPMMDVLRTGLSITRTSTRRTPTRSSPGTTARRG